MAPRPHLFPRGFSLVEIVLALGIIGFVGLALIGLLGVGLDSSREATEETACGLVARRVFSELETEALSAEDLSSEAISPFNPAYAAAALTKRYYFTREGIFLGRTAPNPPDPARDPFFLAEALIKTPSSSLASGVSNQGVSAKELRSAVLTIKWPVSPATGAVPAGAKGSTYSSLLSKGIYRKSLEGDR